MREQFARTELMIGGEGVARLQKSAVLIFGIGGVGSYVTEGLARAGVGALTLVDKDRIEITNLNRQLPALHSTIGRCKAEVMAQRVLDINPDCQVESVQRFFLPDNAHEFHFGAYDYIVDAIDTVAGKIALIEKACREQVPIISAMGTGNKLDPSLFQIAAIEDTRVCPLARVMRRELKRRNIKGIKVLYSEETPIKPGDAERRTVCEGFEKVVPGSISFVPSAAGLMIAGEVVRDLLQYG